MNSHFQDDFHVIAPLHNPEALKAGDFQRIDQEFKAKFLEQYGGSHQSAEAITHIKYRGYPDDHVEFEAGVPINWGLGIDKAGVRLSSIFYAIENHPELINSLVQEEFPQLTDKQCEGALRTIFLLLSSLESREWEMSWLDDGAD